MIDISESILVRMHCFYSAYARYARLASPMGAFALLWHPMTAFRDIITQNLNHALVLRVQKPLSDLRKSLCFLI